MSGLVVVRQFWVGWGVVAATTRLVPPPRTPRGMRGIITLARGSTPGRPKRKRRSPLLTRNFVFHCFRAMKNITVTLPEDTALWVRIRAAERGRSVSRWLADLLVGMHRGEGAYDAAMERFFAREPRKLTWSDGRRPTRDDLHERADVR